MKKSVEKISLTAYELTVLLRYVVNYKDLIINYDFEGDSSLGASCFIDIENIYYKNLILGNMGYQMWNYLIPNMFHYLLFYDRLREEHVLVLLIQLF